MVTAYPACFYKEKEGNYSVIFPDLNHLSTCGDTLDDTLAMAMDCLAGYIYVAQKQGEEIPAPSCMEAIDVNAEYDDYDEAFVNMVAVDVEEYAKTHFEQSVKKTLSIPKWLNDMAVAESVNFSQLLQEALKKKLNVS